MIFLREAIQSKPQEEELAVPLFACWRINQKAQPPIEAGTDRKFSLVGSCLARSSFLRWSKRKSFRHISCSSQDSFLFYPPNRPQPSLRRRLVPSEKQSTIFIFLALDYSQSDITNPAYRKSLSFCIEVPLHPKRLAHCIFRRLVPLRFWEVVGSWFSSKTNIQNSAQRARGVFISYIFFHLGKTTATY